MVWCCWSVKGGVGTTVVAAALALAWSRASEAGVLLVDLAGDQPAALGVAEPRGKGVAGWLAAGPDVPADAVDRLAEPVAPGLWLLGRGRGPLDADRADALAGVLADDARVVVVDAGCPAPGSAGAVLAASAARSLLVTRPCFLALRRVAAAPAAPSGVVLVDEPGRALGVRDVEAAVGAPVVAHLALDPALARAVDAGILAARLPRTVERALRAVA